MHLDTYEESPAEGWPDWMTRQVREATFVVVVCTAVYHRRVSGREVDGVGLGARWEGTLITQDMYDAGGRNTKFIPIVFDADDVKEIPAFLRSATRYDVSTNGGYDRLYRRLTGQPSVRKPVLGKVRQLGPEAGTGSLPAPRSRAESKAGKAGQSSVPSPRTRTKQRSPSRSREDRLLLLQGTSGQAHFYPIIALDARAAITVTVSADSPGGRVFLEELRTHRWGAPTVEVAFSLTSARARVESVARTLEDGNERFMLQLAPERDGPSRGFHEMSTGSHSADAIAELRARVILLDERLASQATRSRLSGGDQTLDWLVKGSDPVFTTERSPLPSLYRDLVGATRGRVEPAAKLLATLWLRATGTVEHVLELDMRLVRGPALSVDFRGRRAKVYTNREPVEIRVKGRCPLG